MSDFQDNSSHQITSSGTPPTDISRGIYSGFFVCLVFTGILAVATISSGPAGVAFGMIAIISFPALVIFFLMSFYTSARRIFRAIKHHERLRIIDLFIFIVCGVTIAGIGSVGIHFANQHQQQIEFCRQKQASGEYVLHSEIPEGSSWSTTKCDDLYSIHE